MIWANFKRAARGSCRGQEVSMKSKTDPNVVPLCDILLVLLIIFMVITPMTQQGLDIKLPELGTDDESKAIVLTIEKDGTANLNNEKYLTMDALENRLRELYLTRPGKSIFIQVHESIPYKTVINTIDLIKKSGVDIICAIPKRYK